MKNDLRLVISWDGFGGWCLKFLAVGALVIVASWLAILIAICVFSLFAG